MIHQRAWDEPEVPWMNLVELRGGGGGGVVQGQKSWKHDFEITGGCSLAGDTLFDQTKVG